MRFVLSIAVALICSQGWALALPKITFLDLSACNQDKYSSPSCLQFQSNAFAKWTPADQSTVQNALESSQQAKAEIFFSRLKQLGLREVQFIRLNDGLSQAETIVVSSGVAQIALRPQFFDSRAMYGKVSEQQHALLHELFHVFIHLTVGEDYYRGSFWQVLRAALEWHVPDGMNPLVSNSQRKDAGKLSNVQRGQGQWDLAIKTDLDFARGNGFPSIYSMTQIGEYVPELGSFLIFDQTLQASLPDTVVLALKGTPFEFLIDGSPPEVNDPESARFETDKLEAEFVGMLFSEERFLCTVFIVKHGIAGTAKHCLDDSWGLNKPQGAGVHYTFLTMEFSKSDGTRVRVSGFSITGVFKDSGKNDLAYLVYDPAETAGKVQVPILDFVQDQNAYDLPGTPLFSIQYALPAKAQMLRRMQSKPCGWTGEVRELADTPYQGPLHGTTCPAWYGASGSPLLSLGSEPGHLNVWGVLSHTFDADQNVTPPLASRLKDNWGSFTSVNYTPVYLGKEFLEVTK